jgi:hypothetical protein
MKSPALVGRAIAFSVVLSWIGAAPVFAQQQQPMQVTSPDPWDEAANFFGAAGGWTWNPSIGTAAEFSGYWMFSFGKITLAPPSGSHDRSFGFDRFVRSAPPATEIVMGVVGEVGFIPSESTSTFMGGPRVTIAPAKSRVAAYGEFLLGGLHFSGDFSGTDKVMMPAFGAVIDIPHNKLQLTAEIGFPIDFFDGFHDTDKRFQVGVMVPLAHR